jgi:hypothetical protein
MQDRHSVGTEVLLRLVEDVEGVVVIRVVDDEDLEGGGDQRASEAVEKRTDRGGFVSGWDDDAYQRLRHDDTPRVATLMPGVARVVRELPA